MHQRPWPYIQRHTYKYGKWCDANTICGSHTQEVYIVLQQKKQHSNTCLTSNSSQHTRKHSTSHCYYCHDICTFSICIKLSYNTLYILTSIDVLPLKNQATCKYFKYVVMSKEGHLKRDSSPRSI